MDEPTGAICDHCANSLLVDIRQTTGWAYHVVVSRSCAHLLPTISSVLRCHPHFKVVLDRRHSFNERLAIPHPGFTSHEAFSMPPRPYHLVIRQDCAYLLDDLARLFAGREDIRVLVDRRGKSRTLSRNGLNGALTLRHAEPPAWLT